MTLNLCRMKAKLILIKITSVIIMPQEKKRFVFHIHSLSSSISELEETSKSFCFSFARILRDYNKRQCYKCHLIIIIKTKLLKEVFIFLKVHLCIYTRLQRIDVVTL